MSSQSHDLQSPVSGTKSNERGQTLILFLLMMVILFAFVGLGVDLGFAYITKARLSKAVDSAALSGMRNINQGTVTASLIAANAFKANYGASGRDVTPPVPTITFSNDASGSVFMNVSATVSINTYFIRVLPAIGLGNWNTLTVGSSAQATRSILIMALVLDRSDSMNTDGGATAMPPAVTNFIAQFDDKTDYASQVSFSSAATVDVPMEQPFISDITTAALNLKKNNRFGGYTCSDQGLTNGYAQIGLETNVAAQSVVRVMVFFTDGMANTFDYIFTCGSTNLARDITYDGNLYDPTTGNGVTGCTIPSKLSSMDPSNGVLTANAVATSGSSSCVAMHDEAQNRAERIAWLARNDGYIVYSIGMGSPGVQGECNNAFPVLNEDFLKNVANTTDSATYDPNQTEGDFAVASDYTQVNDVFNTIAAKILLRLSQ